MITRSRFQAFDAQEAARFLAGLGGRSSGSTASAAQLVEADRQPDRLGTFLLKRDGAIIALVHVDDRQDGGRVAVFSGVEVDSKCRQEGSFWRLLGEPLIRAFASTSSFDRLLAVAESKGDPMLVSAYRRLGFRVVPQPSSQKLMENYLPFVIRHPAVAGFFARHDFLRSLEKRQRSGGDGICCGSLRLFGYGWSAGSERLQVMVDWERRQIVSIERGDWVACCFTASQETFKVHYWVRNKGTRSMSFCVEKGNGEFGRHRLQTIAGGQTASGDIFVADGKAGSTTAAPVTAVSVILTIDGERVPFQLRRLKVHPGTSPGTSPDTSPSTIPGTSPGQVGEPAGTVGWSTDRMVASTAEGRGRRRRAPGLRLHDNLHRALGSR